MSATARTALRHCLLCATALLACGAAAAGPMVSEQRAVAAFERIALSGPADLEFRQGSPQRVVVEAAADVIGRISARVTDGVLHFDYGPRPFVTDAPLRFLVRAPTLTALQASGSGDVRVHSLEAARLTLEVAGSGEVTVDALRAGELAVSHAGAGNLRIVGQTRIQRVDVSGSGDLDAASLHSQEATVRMSGSGDAALHVERQLDASLSGSGDLRVSGQPQLKRSISGSGELLRGDEVRD